MINSYGYPDVSYGGWDYHFDMVLDLRPLWFYFHVLLVRFWEWDYSCCRWAFDGDLKMKFFFFQWGFGESLQSDFFFFFKPRVSPVQPSPDFGESLQSDLELIFKQLTVFNLFCDKQETQLVYNWFDVRFLYYLDMF